MKVRIKIKPRNTRRKQKERTRQNHGEGRQRWIQEVQMTVKQKTWIVRMTSRGGKNKSSSSGAIVQVVGMHGKVPDLAKHYNSFQDEITITELIEEFEIQAYGLGIARTQWARLLATYLKHSALIEYQNVIKEHPKYADNYEKLKEALMGKFGTRGGQHKSSESFTKTKGTDTV